MGLEAVELAMPGITDFSAPTRKPKRSPPPPPPPPPTPAPPPPPAPWVALTPPVRSMQLGSGLVSIYVPQVPNPAAETELPAGRWFPSPTAFVGHAAAPFLPRTQAGVTTQRTVRVGDTLTQLRVSNVPLLESPPLPPLPPPPGSPLAPPRASLRKQTLAWAKKVKGGLDKSSAVLEHVDAAARRAGARKAQRGKGTPRRAGAVSAAVAPTASPATTVSPTPPLQGSTSGLFVHVNPSTHAGDSTAQPQLQQEKGGRLEGGGRKKTSKAKESRPDPEEATSSSAGYFATVPATEG